MELLAIKNNLSEIKQIWIQLTDRNSTPYFLSWGWIETWLSQLPDSARVYLATARRDGQPVLAFFTGHAQLRRSRFFSIRQLSLNISGHNEYDKIFIEYNAILHAPGFQYELRDIVQSIPLQWEEFYLPGIECKMLARTGISNLPASFEFIIDQAVPSPYVNLEKVRRAGSDYLVLLSANIRYQIRRSLRELHSYGTLEVEAPENLDQAFLIFDELMKLHQDTWQKRGEPGAFSSDLFCRFHRKLIENRFGAGEIQLLRIRCGETTLGCLYNFVQNGRVYFYQSGLNYTLGKKIQPGLVAHFAAVNHNVALGNSRYDFLGGHERYKQSLATDCDELIWGRIQQKSLKLQLEKHLRQFHAGFRKQLRRGKW